MFYCNSGDLLVVKPYVETTVYKMKSLSRANIVLYTEAIESKFNTTFPIEENEIVMALEASVAPFYWSDMVKCLWKEKIFHIRRVDLKHLSK